MGDNQKPEDSLQRALGMLAFGVFAAVVFGTGLFDSIKKSFERNTTTDKLATMHYQGEWSYGEYRECTSLNLSEQDRQPDLECSPYPRVEKVFKVGFSGELTYDNEKDKSAVIYWLCRRNDSEPSFSCAAKENPVPEQKPAEQKPSGIFDEKRRALTDEEVDNLRRRNECEQRFYDKKIFGVGTMTVMEACKENPNRMP